MVIKPFDYLLQHLRLRTAPPSSDDETDGRMLQRFLVNREETAFAGLMRRHGPMVLAVCRRLLDEPADVEDAFQATFLVLVRRAASVRRHESVGSFLHGVALRVARRIRDDARRRRLHERRASAMSPTQPPDPVLWRDLRLVLDEELDRLPEKYRAPLVLCYLEGKSHEEAARQLGWPNGTVCGRLARARDLLRGRLARRGLTLSAATLAALSAENALSAAVPAALAGAALRAAVSFRPGQTAAAALAPRVLTLAEQTAKAMFLRKIERAIVVTFLLALLAGGAGIAIRQSLQAEAPPGEMIEAPLAEQQQQAADKTPADDREDAPLPAGAIARLGTTRFRHAAHVAALAFSPDGKTLAAVGDDASVILWDAATGAAMRTLGDYRPVLGRYEGTLAFSPDGKSLAIGHDNSSVLPVSNWWIGVTMWDFVSRKQRYPLVPREHRSIRSIAFSPAEDHWAAADDSGGVYLWDIGHGDQATKLDVPDGVSYSVAFSPDKKDLILATREDTRTFGKKGRGEVIFWDIARRKKHRGFIVDRDHFVESLCVSPDGKTLAVLAGGSASLWDAAKGEKVRDLKPGTDVRCLAFSPDGKTLALGCHEPPGKNAALGAVFLLDATAGQERLRLEGFSACLAFSPDGRRLAAGGLDCVLRLWDARTGKLLTPAACHTDAVTCVAVSADGKTIVSAGDGGIACLWDAATGAMRQCRRLQTGFGTYAGFGAVRITPDGQILATRGSTPYGPPRPRAPILWDVRSGKELLAVEPPNARGGPACPFALSPDGKTVAMGVEDTVALWDVGARKQRLRLRGCEGPVYDIAFSADGTTLVTYEIPEPRAGQSLPSSLRLWDLKTGKQLHKITTEHLITPFALSPDGKLCASKSLKRGIDIWDVPRGEKLYSIPMPDASASTLAFSPDGRTVLSGDSGGNICFWEVKTGKQTRKLTGHRGPVRALVFAGEMRLISAGSDTTLLVWDLSAGREEKAP